MNRQPSFYNEKPRLPIRLVTDKDPALDSYIEQKLAPDTPHSSESHLKVEFAAYINRLSLQLVSALHKVQ
jgi:hypothetical protein